MDGVGDDEPLALNAPAVADLLDLGIAEQIRVPALQRPLVERGDLLVEHPGDRADLAPADPQPEAVDELVDAARRDAADIGLLHDRDQCLLRALSGLQEAREVAALADLWDLQLDFTRARVPPPRPIAVAMRRPVRSALTVRSTHQLGDLGLHELPSNHP